MWTDDNLFLPHYPHALLLDPHFVQFCFAERALGQNVLRCSFVSNFHNMLSLNEISRYRVRCRFTDPIVTPEATTVHRRKSA